MPRTASLRTYFSFLMGIVLCSCSNYGQLSMVTDLPKKLKECSGMEILSSKSVWLIEDSGNEDEIYNVDFKGNILRVLEVNNAKNKDWEDLTLDEKGNLYIGDFGNNANQRKDLVIYKLPHPEKEPGDKIAAEKIKFFYPEQEKFPPQKARRNYDAEAFFHWKDTLYIITKNRSHPFPGNAQVYSVPAQKGTYQANRIGTLSTCNDWETCQVTSADIASDGKTIVLLGYGKLWKITDFQMPQFFNGTVREIDLGIRTQLESVCFVNDSTLLLADEKRKLTGRNLYTYTLR